MRPKPGAWLEWGALVVGLFALGALGAIREAGAPAASADTHSSTAFDPGGTHAWYDMLSRMGAGVDRFELRPAFLTDAIRTLVVVPPDVSTPAGRAFDGANGFARVDVAALAQWVRRGGRLLVAEPAPRLLTALRNGSGGVPAAGRATAFGAVDQCRAVTRVTRNALGGSIEVLALGCARLRVPVGCGAAVADERGAVVASCVLGRGLVLWLGDPQAVSNSAIGRADNARMAYALAAPRGGGLVAFDERVHGFAAGEGLWQILPGAARWALLIAGVAVLVFLCGRGVRLGPPVVVARPEASHAPLLDALAALYQAAGARAQSARDAIDAVDLGIGLRDDPAAVDARACLQTLKARQVRTDAELIEIVAAAQALRAVMKGRSPARRQRA